MTFSCLDRPGVSSLMKNDKFLMNCDRFVDIGRNRGTRWNTIEKLSDSDQNLVKSSPGFSSSPSICIIVIFDLEMGVNCGELK